GLWALIIGNGANGGDKNALYFSAGPDSETHGLFGSLRAIPDDPAAADATTAAALLADSGPPDPGLVDGTSGTGTTDPGPGDGVRTVAGPSPNPQTTPGAAGATAATVGSTLDRDALFALDLLFASDVFANGSGF